MTLLIFGVSSLIAGGCGMLVALICRRGLRNGQANHAELRSQVEQLRRQVSVLELQFPRAGIGRREMQLIARISTVLLQ